MPGPDGEHVVVVAQHRAQALAGDLDLGELQLVAAEDRADPVAQHGHEDGAVARRPVDVEPLGVRGVGPFGEHRPQRAVVPDRRRHGHVVGHDVEHEPEAGRVRDLGQVLQGGHPAELGSHLVVVDDVVPVRRPGGGPQDRARGRRGSRRATPGTAPGRRRRAGSGPRPSCTRYVETGTGRPAVGSRRVGVGRVSVMRSGAAGSCAASASRPWRRSTACGASPAWPPRARPPRRHRCRTTRPSGVIGARVSTTTDFCASVRSLPASTVVPDSTCESVSNTAVHVWP